MKKLVFLLLFLSVPSYAGWSSYVRITPENKSKYGLNISFNKLPEQNKFLVKFNDPKVKVTRLVSYKTAWLILSRVGLSEAEQNQSYTLGTEKVNENILSASKLGEEYNDKEQRFYSALIDSSVIDRTYIFVGYNVPVNDGGLHYSIDLKAFHTEYSNANKSIKRD